MNIKQLDEEYIAHTYARFPIQIASGKGALAVDENGKDLEECLQLLLEKLNTENELEMTLREIVS